MAVAGGLKHCCRAATMSVVMLSRSSTRKFRILLISYRRIPVCRRSIATGPAPSATAASCAVTTPRTSGPSAGRTHCRLRPHPLPLQQEEWKQRQPLRRQQQQRWAALWFWRV